jgi:hypothetical protein
MCYFEKIYSNLKIDTEAQRGYMVFGGPQSEEKIGPPHKDW